MQSTKGHNAASWTADNNKRQIFTARLRILETAIPIHNKAASSLDDAEPQEKVTTAILLEDSSSGELFAAAPYTSANVVEQAIDSSRFFALLVVSGNRKATLGIGFEERSDAFDFNIAMQDAKRVLELEGQAPLGGNAPGKKPGRTFTKDLQAMQEKEKKDYSLKEGETITVNIGGRPPRPPRTESGGTGDSSALFSIKPPPPAGVSGAAPLLPPPPSAEDVKKDRRRSRSPVPPPSAKDMGFDDGEFGEFQ